MHAGRFASSRSHLEQVLALHDPISDSTLVHRTGIYPHVNSQGLLGIVLFCLGFPDQALAQSRAAIAAARKLAHLPSLAASLTNGTTVLALAGDNAALDEWTGEVVAVTTQQPLPVWRAQGTILRGWVKVKTGDVAEGISLLRRGSGAYRATGAEAYLPYFFALLAGACEIAGQVAEAMSVVDQALEVAQRTGQRWLAAELNRLKGKLLLRQEHPEAAERLYRKALRIAQEQEARLWELRAAVSLATLLRDHGRRFEAHDLLAPVYGWFTEGFGTRDLEDAKGLLDGLS
jgi:predicted ATPase